MITQSGLDPVELRALVAALRYKPEWEFDLVDDLDRGQGSVGMTFRVLAVTQDGYHPERERRVWHYMIVPAAAYDRREWARWLLDQLILIEQHEACEFFRFRFAGAGCDERPYAPNHGPGRNPYVIHELGRDEDARTSFRGETKPPAASQETP